MPSFSCEAILFDLDGVLVDSTPCVTRVWSNWAQQRGLDPGYVLQVAHGQRTIETVRIVAPNFDAQEETDSIEQMELADTDGLRALPGAKDLLGQIPPDRYTIVTSGTRRLATKRLRVAGLPVPARMITADDVSRGKPDPEPYLAGARVLGIDPSLCLVFEDAPSGIQAARNASMTVLAVRTTFGPEELRNANRIISSLREVQVMRGTSNGLLLTVQAVV